MRGFFKKNRLDTPCALKFTQVHGSQQTICAAPHHPTPHPPESIHVSDVTKPQKKGKSSFKTL